MGDTPLKGKETCAPSEEQDGCASEREASGGAECTPRTDAASSSHLRRYVLPNQLEIAYQSRAEVPFFYKDIFEKQIYLKNGLTIEPGNCIFDIGANIGFFTLFAHRQAQDLLIFAFEPAPPLFEVLNANVLMHGVNARLFNCGISDAPKTATFTFYPNSSGMSSFYADEQEEKEALRAIMRNQLQQGMSGMEQVMHYADELLEERLKNQLYECRLRTVSEIIAEQGVTRIDFMKIDVQKAELDVLKGISEDDWPKIKQIVIEVHDFAGRLNYIHELLRVKGYHVIVEQDDHYENSVLYNLYAIRRSAPVDAARGFGGARQMDQNALKQMQERARKQEEALNRRRQIEQGKKVR
jgi:FkbM family methyltransferase